MKKFTPVQHSRITISDMTDLSPTVSKCPENNIRPFLPIDELLRHLNISSNKNLLSVPFELEIYIYLNLGREKLLEGSFLG